MSDEKMMLVAGGAGLFGAIATALGNAFGFNRRLNKLETSVDCIKRSKAEYVTKPECIDKLKSTEKVVDLQFGRHTEQIADLKASQEKGFSAIFEKLDRIIANGGS